jgi:hypothetical protein
MIAEMSGLKYDKGGGKWKDLDTFPIKQQFRLNDSVSLGHPCVTKDEKMLIFASDASDINGIKSFGGRDLWSVNFVFNNHFWGIQIDCATGKLLHIEERRSDYIEKIHDGSIIDFYIGNKGGQFKLVYTSIMGLALLTFTITGFWLWYGPKRMRKRATNH